MKNILKNLFYTVLFLAFYVVLIVGIGYASTHDTGKSTELMIQEAEMGL